MEKYDKAKVKASRKQAKTNTARALKEGGINAYFRKLAARRLELKSLKLKLNPNKHPGKHPGKQSRLRELLELESDALKLQELKKNYSFADSQSAQKISKIFASAFEDFEAKLSRFKSGTEAGV